MHVFKRNKAKDLLLNGLVIASFTFFTSAFAEDEAAAKSSVIELNEPRFVSDVLYVPLRSGNSNQHRIVHKGLKSGTTLTLLEESDGWARVRTTRNLEGWIQTRYLFNQPTANLKLIRAQKQVEQLTTKAGPLGEKLLAAESQLRKLEQTVKSLEQEKNRKNKELDRIKGLSSDQIRLDKDNKSLHQSNEELRNELDTLKAENTRLSTKLLSNDIMYGAFAVLLGLIATLVIQHLTRSRKRSEWS